jgi:hypothetical protein
MFTRSLAALAAAVALVHASAVPAKRATFSNTDVLNYALSLEHIENAFYAGALAQFNETDFGPPGNEEFALYQQILSHEAKHVSVLTKTLQQAKVTPVAACNYTFPYTDVTSFRALALILEGVGVSAYLGAADLFNNDATDLTTAAAILGTEARHAAWIATVNGADPWSDPFDGPLNPNAVFTLAAPFIGACPANNPVLPLTAFPALTVSPSTGLVPDANVTLTVPASFNATGPLFTSWITGTTPEFLPWTINASTNVPHGSNGTSTIYVVITTSNDTVSDDNTVAGPAIVTFSSQFPAGTVTTAYIGNGSASATSGSAGAAATAKGAASSTRSAGMLGAAGLAVVAAMMLAL